MQSHAVSQLSLARIKSVLEQIKNRSSSGAILEFGVWEGYSLSKMVSFLRENKMTNKVYGFDSFAGLPASEPNLKDGKMWNIGEYASTLQNTKSELINVLGHIDDISLIQGVYSQILNQELLEGLNIQKADLVHVDCDMISSCEDVLNFCKPIIKPGTFLVFDEWDLGEDRCWRAFEERYIKSARVIPVEISVSCENYIVEVLELK